MSVINFPTVETKENDYEVSYLIDNDTKKVIGVGHPLWGFTIQRNDDEIAIVDEEGNPFGILPADVFNTVLARWLLIDSPELINQS